MGLEYTVFELVFVKVYTWLVESTGQGGCFVEDEIKINFENRFFWVRK